MSAPVDQPPILLLAGPTAVGKSEVSLLLAQQLEGEIVSADSMQVYRGLDIGAAKPSPAERAAVPHHLIDIIDCHEPFDAARFRTLARQAITEIHHRKRLPIVCGGTGLYFKVLLEGLGEAPPADPALRASLARLSLEVLLRELAENDPVTFERIDHRNPRRVVRAVEILRLTGRPASSLRASWRSGGESQTDHAGPTVIGLRREPGDLRARIDARVEQMFADGLVGETRRLASLGLADNPTACQAIGYRQVLEHLRGERGLRETVELVKIKTRQFSKRQMTWFRRQLPMQWIEVTPNEPAAAVAERMRLALFGLIRGGRSES